jgi:hypothetical protein
MYEHALLTGQAKLLQCLNPRTLEEAPQGPQSIRRSKSLLYDHKNGYGFIQLQGGAQGSEFVKKFHIKIEHEK